MLLNENRVRERAYQIWESEGRPDGCAEKHWSMACEYEQNTSEDSYSTLGEEMDAPLNQIKPKKKSKHSRH
jgi:hypothetical protein